MWVVALLMLIVSYSLFNKAFKSINDGDMDSGIILYTKALVLALLAAILAIAYH